MVLAVNAYNEPKATIEKFVREKKLKQRVLLQGRAVGQEKYMVRGFPTTFFIDRTGKIVRREVGFAASAAPRVEAMIVELVGKQPRGL